MSNEIMGTGNGPDARNSDNNDERAAIIEAAGGGLRRMAEASRQFSEIMERMGLATDRSSLPHQKVPLEQCIDFAKQAQPILQKCPELFDGIFYMDKPPEDPQEFLFRGLGRIMLGGGKLPLQYTADGAKRHTTPEELELNAELRESIAAGLYDTPPSDDFAEVVGFPGQYRRQSRTEYLMRCLEVIYKASKNVKDYRDTATRVDNDLADRIRRAEKITETSTLVERALYALEVVHLHIDQRSNKNSKFGDDADLLNDPNTTIGAILERCRDGRERAVGNYLDIAAHYEWIVNAVISGEAATYKAPE